MEDYINSTIGFEDIFKLFDYSGMLGYTVDPALAEIMEKQRSKQFVSLCSKSIINVPRTSTISMTNIIDWAIDIDRLPIVVYNPNFTMSDTAYESIQAAFTDEGILRIGLNDPDFETVDSKIKCVYTNKLLTKWSGRMPLLISYVNLMHGKSKKDFVGLADKIIYYCEPLPNR
jgi:hypothetical protein